MIRGPKPHPTLSDPVVRRSRGREPLVKSRLTCKSAKGGLFELPRLLIGLLGEAKPNRAIFAATRIRLLARSVRLNPKAFEFCLRPHFIL